MSFFTTSRVQILILAGLILVRFGEEIIGQPAFVVLTYLLSYLFFKTIPIEDRYLYNLNKPNKKAVLIAVTIAIICMVINTVLELVFFGGTWILTSAHSNPIIFAVLFPITLIYWISAQFILNALPEEFLFRGFLWGTMRRSKLSDFSILCSQAILFWAGHYFMYNNPMPWIRVLVMGIIYGIVAWKTKSLFVSAIVHACFNASAEFVHMDYM